MSTLFVIEHALADLFDTRQELMDQVAFTDEQIAEKQAALDAVDAAIVEYITKEVHKVDNIARLLIDLKAREQALADEAERLEKMANVCQQTSDRIKAIVLQVMRDYDVRKLEGRIGTLRRQASGGVQGVDIRQPELLPEEYRKVRAMMDGEMWNEVCGLLRTAGIGLVHIRADEEPDLTAIGEALRNGQAVPGCQLKERGEHLRVS